MATTFDLSAISPMLDLFEAKVRDANKAGTNVKDLTSGRSERIANFINTSDEPKILEYRQWAEEMMARIQKAQEALNARKSDVEAFAESEVFGSEGEVDLDGLRKDFAEKRRTATEMRKALLTLIASMGANDPEEVLSAELEDRGVTEIIGLRGQTRAGAAGGGTKRPRLSAAFVNGEPVPVGTKGMPTFTTMAAYISKNLGATNAEDLKAAAFRAAGTDNLSEHAGDINFVFTLPAALEGKSRDVHISLTPKTAEVSEAPSVSSADDSEDDESEEE